MRIAKVQGKLSNDQDIVSVQEADTPLYECDVIAEKYPESAEYVTVIAKKLSENHEKTDWYRQVN